MKRFESKCGLYEISENISAGRYDVKVRGVFVYSDIRLSNCLGFLGTISMLSDSELSEHREGERKKELAMLKVLEDSLAAADVAEKDENVIEAAVARFLGAPDDLAEQSEFVNTMAAMLDYPREFSIGFDRPSGNVEIEAVAQ